MSKLGGMCVAFGCNNRRASSHTSKLTFHRFPVCAELKDKWVKAIRRENWEPTQSSLICSEHFKEDDFDRTSPFRTYLKKNSVPSIFPAFPEYLKQASSKPRRCLIRKLPTPEFVPEKKPRLEGNVNLLNETQLKLIQTKKLLRNTKLKNKRLNKRVANLKNILKSLEKKNLILAEHSDLLSNISKTSLCLFKRESDKNKNWTLTRLYDDRLRNFAITLHFLSPKAYYYVRDTFQTCLPHPRTITRWFATIDAKPGFSSEVLRALKEKCKIQGQLVCSIIFDSMAIRQRVDWDGKNMYGYMDLGFGTTHDGAPIASEVFVIHLVCVNSLWKIPLGYFFIKGITSDQIYCLISQCLALLSNINITIASITCDGTSSNMSSLVKLGCDFKDPAQMKTSFQKNQHTVDVFLDPCHMLKLVRNTLHDLENLIDMRGRLVSWSFLKKLLNLQESEEVQLGNKVGRKHIFYSSQKMKVKLATQLFSTSVADALQYCLNNKIKGFEGSEGTIEFIRVFNDLFDILNSRSLKFKRLKKPLNENNENEIFGILEKAENYIKNLKYERGTTVISGSRKTGFLGFLVCINSLKSMYCRLVKKEKLLKYIPSYKISQDHLERLFSYIRSRGGRNNNPSALEFCNIFRKIIVHKELHESSSSGGNAIPLDKINILGINLSEMSSIDQINLSNPKNIMLEENEITEPSKYEDFTIENNDLLSEVVVDVIEYIAGFIVRRLSTKISCEECLTAISDSPLNTSKSLLVIKNRGGLFQPTYDVTRICKFCERIFREFISENRFDEKRFVNKLLAQCFNQNLFIFSEHLSLDSENNHLNLLIQSIGTSYFKIKIKKLISDKNQSIEKNKIRHKLTKLIHFKGQ